MTSASVLVLFIAGLGRSGSTVLERTLDRLPETVAVGELTHLWERGLGADESCGCGQPFSRCEFWHDVGQVAYGGWGQVDLDRVLDTFRAVERTRHVPRLVLDDGQGRFAARLRALRRLLGRLYWAIREVSGERIVIDSSKDPSYAYVLRGIEPIDLRVVHAIRDSPAVAYSWSKVVSRPDALDTEMARWTVAQTARWWTVQNLLADALRLTGVPVTRVRYEDFVADPVREISRVCLLVDLAPDARLLAELAAGTVDLTSNHSVSGNPMRFTVGGVPIRRDEAWRTAMSTADIRRTLALTAPTRARFGYLGPHRAR